MASNKNTVKAENGQIVAEFNRTGWSGRGDLQTLVDELNRQKEAKLDFVADQRALCVEPILNDKGDGIALKLLPLGAQEKELLGSDGMRINAHGVKQVCGKVSPNVPAQFFDRLLAERPTRAADLVNALLTDTGKRVFVRTMDGVVRACLSDRYRVLDHYDVAFAALDAVQQNNGEVLEATLSDTQMRLKFISRNVWDAINQVRLSGPSGNWYAGGLGDQKWLSAVAARSKGDLPGGPGTVYPAVTISNSETGQGGFNVRIGILAGICFNLATVETAVTTIHLGESLQEGIYREQTRSLESQTIYAKAVDAVTAAFTKENFAALIERCKAAQSVEVKAPKLAIENVAKALAISEKRQEAILEHFLSTYDKTAWGMAQAIARVSQETTDADDASDLEIIAGKVIERPSLVAVEAA